MAKKYVHINNLGTELTEIVTTFIREENEKCREIMPEVAKIAKNTLKANSPGEGPYARGWKIEYENKDMVEYGFQIWNPKHYRLTHLLEKGHLIKNQYGGPFGKGRTQAIPHISKAQNEANILVIQKLEEKL